MKIKLHRIFYAGCVYLCAVCVFSASSFAADSSESPPLIYTKQEILANNSVLDLELPQTASIVGFTSVTKFLVVSPQVASLSMITNSELSVTSGKVGYTFVHIWDAGQVITIRITVKYRGFKKTTDAIEKIKSGEESKSIKLGYSYNLSQYESRSAYNPYRWTSSNQMHRFFGSGDTPYGFFEGDYRYLFRQDREGMARDTDFVNFKLENDYFKAEAGDIDGYFSEVTMPSTHYQGVRFGSGQKFDKIKYDVVMGATGHYLWASRLYPYGQMFNRFYGMRAEMSPTKNISFFGTFMDSDISTAKKESVAAYLSSVGAKYAIAEYLDVQAELAKNNKQRTALITSIKLAISKLTFKSIFRDVTADYLNVTGNTPFRGKKGLYSNLTFKPLRILTFSTVFDVYRNKLNPNLDYLKATNKDFEFNSQLFSPLTNTRFRLSFFQQDHKAQQFPTVSAGERYEFEQNLKNIFLLKDIYAYLRYTPSRYISYTNGESTYLDKTLMMGCTVKPLAGLSLNVSEKWNLRRWPVRDYATEPRRLNTSASYNSKVGKLPVTIGVTFNYQKDTHINVDKLSSILGEDKVGLNAEVKYKPFPFIDCFMRGGFEKVKGSANRELDRNETAIIVGASISWDTQVAWQGYGAVRGFVFKDLNRNGIMDKGEPPIEGVRIFADKKKSGTTSRSGFYRIRNVTQGVRKIYLDMTSIPENYSPTTAVNVDVEVKKMESVKVNFGVLPKTVIKGFAFNDLNRNGVFDESDQALPNLFVRLEDETTAFTDSFGCFNMYNVIPGQHTITVDRQSLPKDLLPYGPPTRQVIAKEGTTKNEEFIFYALRVITGRAYMDLNENKKFDETESAKGVKITCAGCSAVTDEAGNYILRNLPSGKVAVTIDKESLPEGYTAEKETIEIELKKDKDIREGVDIRLIPKP